VTIPPRFAEPNAALHAFPDEIERDFVAANTWLKPEMMAVSCQERKLRDIRICFGRDLPPRPCGTNEDEARLCPRDRVALSPPD
jgi:ribonuclease T2